MKKFFIGSLLCLVLAIGGFAIVNLVYYPRIDQLHQEMQALEEELTLLKDRLKRLQEIAKTSSDLPKLFDANGSQINYDLWFTMNSSFMFPTLMVGDIVYVRSRTNSSIIEVDDIIAFFNPNAWNTISIHRVIEKQEIEADLTFLTKGDNKSSRDPWPIPWYNVIGKVVAYRRGNLIDVF
jgi:signal peptidase I